MNTECCMSRSIPQIKRIPLTDWRFREYGQSEWLPATVPGCVHTDLLAANLIGDPFYRDNEYSLQWIGERAWEYRCRIPPQQAIHAAERAELVFEGLDTFAEISVNGTSAGSADNMFRTWRFSVERLLREGVNEIDIRFESPLQRGKTLLDRNDVALPAMNEHEDPKVSPFVRKAPYHFGWDWGPRLLTCGVWRHAHLETWTGAVLRDVRYVQRHLDDERALIDLEVTVEAAGQVSFDVAASISGTDEKSSTSGSAVYAGRQTFSLSFTISNPERWWPNGAGDQRMYEAEVLLLNNDTVIDSRQLSIGLRTIELDRTADDDGERFTFVVNGRPLFCKGANWIPADSFPSRLQESEYRCLLESAAKAEMNMLRVWGGGIYESDVFYEWCDRLGLLVWQDFMFSCAMYPADPQMQRSIEHEARDNVRRLRNHPSLALWCGNNEMEWGWDEWEWQRQFPERVWEDYERIFHHLLPSVVDDLDPDRSYWPSSPSSISIPDANAASYGDMHYWGVWHEALPFDTYLRQTPRFMSEYGFQSFPLEKTVSAYARPGDFEISSPVMRAHQKHPNGNALIHTYMKRAYPEAADFPSFLYLSQILQAEGVRIGAEHLRRQKPYCAGSLYWQLNDCWPVASWSSIDYFGRWKALHYAAKRFYAPILLTLHEENGTLCATLVSDLPQELNGSVSVELLSFAGDDLPIEEIDFQIAADAVTTLFRRSVYDVLRDLDPSSHYLRIAYRTKNGRELAARHFFTSPVHLSLPQPEIALKAVPSGDTVSLTLTSASFARAVYLDHPAHEGHFTDNFFDLDPGVEKMVRFVSRAGDVADTFVENLEMRSLVDAY